MKKSLAQKLYEYTLLKEINKYMYFHLNTGIHLYNSKWTEKAILNV